VQSAAIRMSDDPKIASSCATVAPLLAACIAGALRNPCADFLMPARATE